MVRQALRGVKWQMRERPHLPHHIQAEGRYPRAVLHHWGKCLFRCNRFSTAHGKCAGERSFGGNRLGAWLDTGIMKYVASCSFGKDSLATILLALMHSEPLDEVVYCEEHAI